MGAVPSPFDCYLVNRSLKTLALRMEQHKKSSLVIAKWLQNHPKVAQVLHPGKLFISIFFKNLFQWWASTYNTWQIINIFSGLPTHPQYEIAKKQTGGHSGVFSFFHVGGLKESRKFLSSLKVFTLAESLGGYESLAELPWVFLLLKMFFLNILVIMKLSHKFVSKYIYIYKYHVVCY